MLLACSFSSEESSSSALWLQVLILPFSASSDHTDCHTYVRNHVCITLVVFNFDLLIDAAEEIAANLDMSKAAKDIRLPIVF